MKYNSAEVKSGFLITVSLVLLVGLTFWVGNVLGGGNQVVQIRFGYIGGLEAGSPVYYAGTEVGKVDTVEIVGGQEKPVLITARIADFVQIKNDSETYIDTLGMMGEKFVEITPGSVTAPLLAPGTKMLGEDPIPIREMILKMNLLADRMDELTTNLNPMIENANDLLATSKEDLAKTLANAHEISRNIRDMTHDLKYRPWRLVRKD